MKRVILLAVCIVIAVSAGLAFRARADADKTFNNKTLNDKYGFHVVALSLNPSDPNAPTFGYTVGLSDPFAVSGYYEFHGDGTL
jgi:hypothetical protein